MGNHNIQIINAPERRAVYAKCSCKRWTSSEVNVAKRWEVEDAHRKHVEQVQRALAGLRRSVPSVDQTHAYYQQMASDPNVPAADRALWAMLAREMEPHGIKVASEIGDSDAPLF